MTDKQRKFADEYLIDCNAARAYKAAYPNVKKDETARVNASRLLTNANIKSYIAERLEKISSDKIADTQEVLEHLTAVLRGEMVTPVLRFVSKGVQTIDYISVPESERLKAAELLGKRYGLFNTKVNLEVEPVMLINDLKE